MAKIIQLPCRFMQDYMKPTLRELYNLTQENNREFGLYIYEKDGEIYLTQIQVGGPNSIGIRMKSVLGEGLINAGLPLATIHSHPDQQYNYLFSGRDFKTMIDSGLEFAAVVFKDPSGPRCSVYSTEKYNSYAELKYEVFNKRFGYDSNVSQLDLVESMNNELRICEFKV